MSSDQQHAGVARFKSTRATNEPASGPTTETVSGRLQADGTSDKDTSDKDTSETARRENDTDVVGVRAERGRYRPALLLLAAAIGALCGIVYELLMASLAAYLVGSAVLVFSLTVGGFLASMGLGAWLSRFVRRRLFTSFVIAELVLALFGGLIPTGLFALYAAEGPFLFVQALSTVVLGALVGLELPLLTRMLERSGGLREAIAQALALDYVGALLGSLLFPLVLLPTLGLLAAATATGALGAAAAFVVAWGHRHLRAVPGRLSALALASTIVLAALSIPARAIGTWLEGSLYDAPVILSQQSRYQKIVVTRHRGDVRLFLDGDLQFSSIDEHRYHEALVHPALSMHSCPQRVLLLGAGDGLALREILKHEAVQHVTVIELDPEMIRLARTHSLLAGLNQKSFSDPRVEVIVGDAFALLRDRPPQLGPAYDVILADFPDPDIEALARLYSTAFYGWVRAALAADGLFVTQSSSPFFAPQAFFCVGETLKTVGFAVRSYSADVPSFGPWGFHLAGVSALPQPKALSLSVPTRYLTPALLKNLFDLPGDLAPAEPVVPNRLLEPILVRYHRDDRWLRYD